MKRVGVRFRDRRAEVGEKIWNIMSNWDMCVSPTRSSKGLESRTFMISSHEVWMSTTSERFSMTVEERREGRGEQVNNRKTAVREGTSKRGRRVSPQRRAGYRVEAAIVPSSIQPRHPPVTVTLLLVLVLGPQYH